MWPWEHLAVGYLGYSVTVRLTTGRPPRDPVAVVVLAFATQLPNLVDKPLAWSLGVLPTGTSLAHSVFVAVPLCVVVGVLAWRGGRPAIGAAFAIGYLLHLPSDALYAAVILGSELSVEGFAWPLVPATPIERAGFGANLSHYFGRYVAALTSPDGIRYLAVELLLVGGAFGLWLYDGAPGLALFSGNRPSNPDPHS